VSCKKAESLHCNRKRASIQPERETAASVWGRGRRKAHGTYTDAQISPTREAPILLTPKCMRTASEGIHVGHIRVVERERRSEGGHVAIQWRKLKELGGEGRLHRLIASS
jgi:hypothetical protein